MELIDRDLALIQSWVWDGIEELGQDEMGKGDHFQGMTVQVTHETVDMGEEDPPAEVILVRLFWPHASNPLGQDIHGRYLVSERQYVEVVDRQGMFNFVGRQMGKDVCHAIMGEEYSGI